MKRLILLTLILCLLPAFALAQQVLAAEHIPLEDALKQLEAAQDPVSQMLKTRLAPLQACAGRYVHPPEPGKKTYVADVTFYLQKGEVYVSVDYTNYSGILSDAPLSPVQDGEYLYHCAPKGSFMGSEQDFSIHFSPEKLRIQWGDGACDYLLIRGDGTETTDDPPFEETDIYDTLMGSLDKNFDGYAHRCTCDEETETVYVYLAMGRSNMYDSFATRAGELFESWQTIVDGVTPYCRNMYEAVKLALRKGITDVTPAHFVFTIVQTLRPGDEYSQRDVLCVIEDGQVTYDRMSDVLQKPSNPGTPPAAATAGQRNALRRAKDYLEIFAFSYDGLVDQLEYEQFTPAEARYGADWCGANWYRQAVRSAESYLELHGFSRQGLIDQLEFEGFTHDQAVYAVRRNGY